MKCVSPFYLTKENLWVPCGRCNFCLQRRRSSWSHRLHQEWKQAESAAFITFTLNDENLLFDISTRKPIVYKPHVQNLLKRIRKKRYQAARKPVRYYAVAEYGSNGERPHYHALLFNLHQDTLGTLQDIWGKGHIHIGEVTPASVAYVTGYVINQYDDKDVIESRTFPFSLMSKGIGSSYLTPAMRRWHKRGKRNYAQLGDHKYPLARYYKDKIFTKLEKATMGLSMEAEIDKRFKTELERLGALHRDPIGYYQQMADQAYNRIKTAKKTVFHN